MKLDPQGFPLGPGDPTPARWTPARLDELRTFVGPAWHEAFDIVRDYGDAHEQDNVFAHLDGLERSAKARAGGDPRPIDATASALLFEDLAAAVVAHHEALAKVHRIGYGSGKRLDRHELNTTQVAERRRSLVEKYRHVVWGVGRPSSTVVASTFDLGLAQGYGLRMARRG